MTHPTDAPPAAPYHGERPAGHDWRAGDAALVVAGLHAGVRVTVTGRFPDDAGDPVLVVSAGGVVAVPASDCIPI